MLLEQMEGREEERGIRERSAGGGGGVAALLNFNEYQGEFLLGFFLLSCSLYVLSPWHTHTHTPSSTRL